MAWKVAIEPSRPASAARSPAAPDAQPRIAQYPWKPRPRSSTSVVTSSSSSSCINAVSASSRPKIWPATRLRRYLPSTASCGFFPDSAPLLPIPSKAVSIAVTARTTGLSPAHCRLERNNHTPSRPNSSIGSQTAASGPLRPVSASASRTAAPGSATAVPAPRTPCPRRAAHDWPRMPRAQPARQQRQQQRQHAACKASVELTIALCGR